MLRKAHVTDSHCFPSNTFYNSSLVAVMPWTILNCFCFCDSRHELNTSPCALVLKEKCCPWDLDVLVSYDISCSSYVCVSGECATWRVEHRGVAWWLRGWQEQQCRGREVLPWSSAELCGSLRCLRNSASAALASKMYRTFQAWNWCCFFWNIRFQLNSCQLRFFFFLIYIKFIFTQVSKWLFVDVFIIV